MGVRGHSTGRDRHAPPGRGCGVLVARTDQVQPPEGRRVHPPCPGQQGGMAREGNGGLARPMGTKVPPWRGSGRHLETCDGRVGPSVAPAHVVGGGEQYPGLHGPIGAAGMDRAHRACDQTPVAAHAGTNRHDGRMRGMAGGAFFPIAQHEVDRTPGHLGQEIGDGQVTRVALAPDRDDVHADVLFSEPQRLRQLHTRPEGGFAGTPALAPAVMVEGEHAGQGLPIALVTAGDKKRVLQHDLGLAPALTHIAFGPRQARVPVVPVRREHVERRADIRRDIVMEQRGLRSHGVPGVEDRRPHVVAVDAPERFLGGVGRRRWTAPAPSTAPACPAGPSP
jgi:hypothetical protein